MRKSIDSTQLTKAIGRRVLYRYSGESVKGTVLAWLWENDYLIVELDNGKTIERHYTSWEVLS